MELEMHEEKKLLTTESLHKETIKQKFLINTEQQINNKKPAAIVHGNS